VSIFYQRNWCSFQIFGSHYLLPLREGDTKERHDRTWVPSPPYDAPDPDLFPSLMALSIPRIARQFRNPRFPIRTSQGENRNPHHTLHYAFEHTEPPEGRGVTSAPYACRWHTKTGSLVLRAHLSEPREKETETRRAAFFAEKPLETFPLRTHSRRTATRLP
jgi:hypothetical protein